MRLGIVAVSLALLVAQLVFSAEEVCVECAKMADAPAANIVYSVDTLGKTLSVTLYYEDPGGTPSRKPINNSVVLIELSNSTGLKEIYKTYTNDNGTATFNFAGWSDACLDMKMMYCPFCNPDSPACGFAECLSYAQIHNESGYYSNNPGPIDSASDIDAGPGAGTEPSTYNPDLYFPALKVAAYCPPPPPLTTTPAMCLPLLIIFSLLSGALYLTGRNPFVGFNIGGARVGRHIRYQARGRGYSMSLMSVVQAGLTIGQAAKTASAGYTTKGKDGKDVKLKGKAALWQSEKDAAKSRAFIIQDIEKLRQGTRTLRIQNTIKRASKGKKRAQVGSSGAGASAPQMVGGQMIFGASGGGGARFGEVFDSKHGWAMIPRIALFVAGNTILGSAIDRAFSIATYNSQLNRGESAFEILFKTRSSRLQEAISTLGAIEVRDGQGKLVGLKVPMGDKFVLVTGGPGVERDKETGEITGLKRNFDGTVTFTVKGEPGAAQFRSSDGSMQVTLGADNKVVGVSYVLRKEGGGATLVTVVQGEGGKAQAFSLSVDSQGRALDPSGKLVFFDSDGKPVKVASVDAQGRPLDAKGSVIPAAEPARPAGIDAQGKPLGRDGQPIEHLAVGVMQDPPASAGADARKAWTAMTSAYFEAAPRGIGIGADLSSFTSSWANTIEAQTAVIGDLRNQITLEQSRAAEGAQSKLLDSSGGAAAYDKARERVAVQTMAYSLGYTPDELASGAPGATGTSLFKGLPDRSAEGMGGAEVALQAVGAALKSDGMNTEDVSKSFIGRSGLQGRDRQTLETAMSGILGGTSLTGLLSMNRDGLTLALIEQGVKQDDARRIAGSVDPLAFKSFSESARPLVDRLRETLPPPLFERVVSRDTAQLEQIGSAAPLMDRDNLVQLMASSPRFMNDPRIPEGARQDLREYAYLENMKNSANSASSAYEQGQVLNAGVMSQRLYDQNYDYLTTGLVNEASRQEGVFAPPRGRGPGEYEQAAQALDHGLAAYRMESSFGVEATTESVASKELQRRESILERTAMGDYSSASALAAEGHKQYSIAADSARALGDETSARRFEDEAKKYGTAMGTIDNAARAGPGSSEWGYAQLVDGVGTALGVSDLQKMEASRPLDSAEDEDDRKSILASRSAVFSPNNAMELGNSVCVTRSSLTGSRYDKLIEVKESIESRLPKEEGRRPLTPDRPEDI